MASLGSSKSEPEMISGLQLRPYTLTTETGRSQLDGNACETGTERAYWASMRLGPLPDAHLFLEGLTACSVTDCFTGHFFAFEKATTSLRPLVALGVIHFGCLSNHTESVR